MMMTAFCLSLVYIYVSGLLTDALRLVNQLSRLTAMCLLRSVSKVQTNVGWLYISLKHGLFQQRLS